MNWLVALLTGSAELGSIAGETKENKEVPKPKASSRYNDEEEGNGYVPLDESMGDPFAD